jgi:serine/threonine-protein kinase
MYQSDRCPECGGERTGGACPRWSVPPEGDGLSPGRSAESPSGDPTGPITGDTPAVGVRETIAGPIGPGPRIRLRDPASGTEPNPVVQPTGSDDDGSIRYRIDGEIARGGMGAVLKGHDPDLNRDVALKVLRHDYRDDVDMIRRFVEEAQIGGQLQHPGIVPIYELGALGDRRPFFAMKPVKGHTVARLLGAREGPQEDLPRLLSIFLAVAQTVAYAHARGVIHRDLKPPNVMVGSFGEVQVRDWGLAKVLPRDVGDEDRARRPDTLIATARSRSDDPALSRPGSAMGTPAYMAPEQGHLSSRAEVARGSTPETRAEAGHTLGGWKADPRLAGIRDADATRSLPADEQAACRALWAEVDALLARLKGGRP